MSLFSSIDESNSRIKAALRTETQKIKKIILPTTDFIRPLRVKDPELTCCPKAKVLPACGYLDSGLARTYFQGMGANLATPSPSLLGRRKRTESLAEWSPPMKARFKMYTSEIASEYGVPENRHEEFIKASMLPTHKLMIVTLAAVLGQHEDSSVDVQLQQYLASASFKDNVVSQIRGALLDPKLPSYKMGFLDQLMYTTYLKSSEIKSRPGHSIAWSKSSQEMTDACFAWVQMKLVNYKKDGSKDKGYWDYINQQLAEWRTKALTLPVDKHAAFSSLITQDARCKPKAKKGSTCLPKWQQDISCAVAEMEAYTLEELQEESDTPPGSPGASPGSPPTS
ncbi:hypothetical protein DFH07DRAFT_773321 [Mycena maculata]|uniref:Uncharacterized protein n=1 Tax=Mycena maculata TaxID=230809 RepID=A0AAD7ND33_9AGAR|nr:hypothetical protein DFH07DRAFT_773321 [Mycena maculata]